ncbi:hypothetical protein H6G00_00580 [Leptolyngbya sp. FACHB-541]|uniref:hypothetical protein n=1 Tax=Leptolyngbya sp. FACHB-541 TaxID=2692810 RepID=UPI0016856855|nr:hypothetical protein [Leptolyngbya sp. FACHB-541]MBD1995124.1 hypothetical protein [Leptolyngbya sp. FACHB-541]
MNFEDYLLQGKILDALRYRVGVLQRTAEKERSNCDGARLVSLGAIAISLPFVAPLPGVGVMAGIAGFSYLGTVWRDFQTSGKLCLLPGSRIGAGDILSLFGLAGEEVSPREQQLMRVMDFLPYEQRVEYAVLVDDEPAIADLLKRLPAQDRLAGYAYMVRRMALGDVKALDLVEVKAAIAAEPAEPTGSAPPTQLQPPSAVLPAVGADKEGDLHSVNLALNPEINVHNHLGRYTNPQKAASPGQAYRQIEAPDLSLYSDVGKRMEALLKSMAQSGFPLGKLLNQPFVWAWGRSQSGKTTIALLLALARAALGHRVSYFTTDDDYPRQVNWSRVEDSPEGYAVALDEVRDTIAQSPKGSLAGHSWLFDEMFAAAAEYDIKIQPLLKIVLMKGAKSKGCVIGISQADTSKAHGLSGIDEAWRVERVSVEAIHEEDELGQRSPTGRYLVSKGNEEGTEEWTLPEWMLTELNQWGSPDPVVWLLNRFPELCKGQSGTQPTQHLEAVVARLDEPEDSADGFSFNASGTDLETLEKLFEEVICEPEPITQTTTETDEQILITWFEKHPDQFYTKRQIVQMKVKVSQPERLEEQLTKLVKDGWLEIEETAQTTKFKWLPD